MTDQVNLDALRKLSESGWGDDSMVPKSVLRLIISELRISRKPSPSAVVLDDERAAFEVWWVRDVPAEYREMSINLLRKSLNEGPSYLKGAWHGWQARAASPQPVAQPVEQTRALTDEQNLIEAIRGWAAKQKPLDAVSAKVLYDNLWDLYVDDTTAQPASAHTLNKTKGE